MTATEDRTSNYVLADLQGAITTFTSSIPTGVIADC